MAGSNLGTTDSGYSSVIWIWATAVQAHSFKPGQQFDHLYASTLDTRRGVPDESYEHARPDADDNPAVHWRDSRGLFTPGGGTHTVTNQLHISKQNGRFFFRRRHAGKAILKLSVISPAWAFKQTGGIRRKAQRHHRKSSASQSSYHPEWLPAAWCRIREQGIWHLPHHRGTNAVTGALTAFVSGSSNGTYDLKGGADYRRSKQQITGGTVQYRRRRAGMSGQHDQCELLPGQQCGVRRL